MWRSVGDALAESAVKALCDGASASRIVNRRLTPVARELQAGENIVERQISIALSGLELLGIRQVDAFAGRKHVFQLPASRDGQPDNAVVGFLAGERHAEIRMRAESAGKRHFAGVFDCVVTVERVADQRVDRSELEVGGPAFFQRRVVAKSMKFTAELIVSLINNAPWPRHDKTVNRVPQCVARFQRVFFLLPGKFCPGKPTWNRTHQRNSSTRRPRLAGGKIGRSIEDFERLAGGHRREPKAVEALADEDFSQGAGRGVTDGKGLRRHSRFVAEEMSATLIGVIAVA